MAQQPGSGVVTGALHRALLVAAGAVLSLSGCQTLSAENDIAAVIVNPTVASRKALQDTLKNALSTGVTLADDALMHLSVLSIEQSPPGSIDAPPAKGRVLDMPVQFRLVKNGKDCILIDQRDDSRHLLADTDCVAGTGRTCDTARNLCVGGSRCIDDSACVGLPNDSCDARLGYCVECLGGSDCADPGATCDIAQGQCKHFG